MKSCNYFKELIEEADKPDVLSFEVTAHIALCGDCERFANERAGLRRLLASGSRVTAPINFDAVLKVRLGEAKARRAFALLSPVGYLQLGAATAGLVVIVFAAQYAGLLSTSDRRVNVAGTPSVTSQAPSRDDLVAPDQASPKVQPESSAILAIAGQRTIRIPRSGVPAGRRTTADGYLTAEDGGVVLVRGQNGDMDVPMPRVSVGAQPLLYVSAGRRPAQTVGTSF